MNTPAATITSRATSMLFGAMFFLSRAVSIAQSPMPAGWELDLQPVFTAFAGYLGSAPQLAAQQTEIRDVELKLVYIELWTRLPAKEQDKLKAEQTNWLATRRKQAAKAAKAEAGDAATPMDLSLAATKLTEERIATLRKQLKAAGPVSAPNRTTAAVPQGWRPDLGKAIAWLDEDSMDGPITAIERNRRWQGELRDAELALAYLELWTRLDEAGREKLKSEQAEWLTARAKKAAAAAEGQDDETLATLKSHHAAAELTRVRMAELRKRISTKATGNKPKR